MPTCFPSIATVSVSVVPLATCTGGTLGVGESNLDAMAEDEASATATGVMLGVGECNPVGGEDEALAGTGDDSSTGTAITTRTATAAVAASQPARRGMR